jgi:pyridoxal phosphate enzyme (YggS family)
MIIFYAMEIANALEATVERINSAASRAGRNPDKIKLVAVSKTVSLDKIIEAVKAGATVLGENRVQEARDKITEFRARNTDLKPEWHLIGNLQKNKARTAVLLFDLIHSVDSEELALILNHNATQSGRQQRVLVQVKLSDEEAKHGIPETKLMDLLEKVTAMENLKLEGLMAIPPFYNDPEKARPYFRKLKDFAESAIKKGYPINDLSMGMSNDFEVAIEEGSTLVRVGTAIFGKRSY